MRKHSLLLLTLLAAGLLLPAPHAEAKAHCYCKMMSLSTTISDFGALRSYGTQAGHDTDCRKLCDNRSSSWWSSNQASACSASHGGTVVAFYAAGTRSYQGGNNYTCPGAHAPEGRMEFGGYAVNRKITING